MKCMDVICCHHITGMDFRNRDHEQLTLKIL
jgi:hypothetical protein